MRNFGGTSGKRITGQVFRIIFVAFVALMAALPVRSALAQVTPPVFTKTFTPNTIGPGAVSTIMFTITNNAAVPVTNLAFTDTLPAAITIATPANELHLNCDEGGAPASLTTGGGTISFSDGAIGVGEICTISVDVTATIPGAHTNPPIILTSSATDATSAAVDLTVDTTLPAFSKLFAPDSISLGDLSTLTFTIDNSLNASAIVELDFTDNLPAGISIASPADATTDCGTATFPPTLTAPNGGSTIIFDANGTVGFPAIAAGSTCTVSVNVNGTSGGTHVNSTELIADSVSAGFATDALEVTVTPLSLTKTFTDDPVPDGSIVTLEFTIQNSDRANSATGVGFADDLLAVLPGTPDLSFSSLISNDCGGSISGIGTSLITFSGGTIAPEATCTIITSITVPAGTPGGAYTNTTTAVTGTVGISPVVGNAASDDLFVQSGEPVLTKSFTDDPVGAGENVTLRFTIDAVGGDLTDIAFDDELTDGGPGTGFLPFPVTVALPPVPNPPCGAGSTLTLESAGTDRQALQLTGGTLDEATSCTFDVTLTIPAGMAPGTYTNTTEPITATSGGAIVIGNSASDDIAIVGSMQFTKEFTDDPVAPGNTATLDFVITNPSENPAAATSIAFDDNLAAALTGLELTSVLSNGCRGSVGGNGTSLITFSGGGPLAPGSSCTISVSTTVPPGASAGIYTNTTEEMTAMISGETVTTPGASGDLLVGGFSFTKEFTDDPVIAGDTVTLEFTIDNTSATDVTSVFFTDSLLAILPGTPDLTVSTALPFPACGGTMTGVAGFLVFSGGVVSAGTSCTISVDLLVPAATVDGVYTNVTSSLSSSLGSLPPAIDDLTVQSVQMELSKEFTDDPVAPGDPVMLEFTLSNLSTSTAVSDVAFTDDLDAMLSGTVPSGLPISACGGTVTDAGSGVIDFSGGNLTANEICTFSVAVSIPGGASAGGYTNTTSSVTGMIGGFAVTGGEASDTLSVSTVGTTFSKSFNGPNVANGTATLTFTITNANASTVTGLSFTDNLDAVISGLEATSLPADPCGPGSSISGTSFLTFSGGELAASGGMCSFDVEVLVPATATAGSFLNTTSNLFASGEFSAPPATASLTIEPPPTFGKSFTPNAIVTGGTSTLEFTIDNSASTIAASLLDFTDTLPAGVTVATPASASTTVPAEP